MTLHKSAVQEIELAFANSLAKMASAEDKGQRNLENGLIYRQLNSLCGMADELDNNGFEKFAKYIDEVIEKISTEAFKK